MPRMPKDPKLKQRRNREPTAATLIDSSPLASGQKPRLPTRAGRPWRVEVKAWWADVWSSPMATEYTQADVHGLLLLADLIESYWEEPSTVKAAEIRLQRQCFGLTPIDRRRLQWEIKRAEEPQKPKPARPERLTDPRAVLKSV